MARHLILIRHGDIGPEYAGRYIGRTDPPLSALGRQQAAALAHAIRSHLPCTPFPARREPPGRATLRTQHVGAQHVYPPWRAVPLPIDGVSLETRHNANDYIPPLRPHKCLCSPLLRTVQTAELAGLQTTICDELREADFGRWDGKSFNEISTADPGLVDQWAAWAPDLAFPDGDRIADFLARTNHIARRMAHDPAETVLVVTHAGVIRALICHLLALEPRHYLLFHVDYASLTTIDLFDGNGVLAGLNDTCHLRGPEQWQP